MSVIYFVGTYSAAALKGFVANPTQDRKEIIAAMTASTTSSAHARAVSSSTPPIG